MKELGLLPLINPSIRERLDPEGQGVTPWDRFAMRFAVAHTFFFGWPTMGVRAFGGKQIS